MLYFGLEKRLKGPYGPYSRCYVRDPEWVISEYIEALIDKSEVPYAFISSQLEKKWFWHARRHILVMDCDSVSTMAAACHWLKTEEHIIYETIQSTPGRFWIVTNFIGTWKEVWGILRYIPGVCGDYKVFAREYKRLCIRAFPKLISGKPTAPIIPEKLNLNEVVSGWVNEVRDYYESSLFKRIGKAIQLTDKISKGAMEILVADPSFQL